MMSAQTILIAYVYPAWSLHLARPQQSRASCLTPGELRKFQWFWDPEIQIPPGKDHGKSSLPVKVGKVGSQLIGKTQKVPHFFGGICDPSQEEFNISRTRTFCFARFSQFCILRSHTMFPAPSFWGYIYIYNGLNLLIHNAQIYHQSLPALEEDSFGGREHQKESPTEGCAGLCNIVK